MCTLVLKRISVLISNVKFYKLVLSANVLLNDSQFGAHPVANYHDKSLGWMQQYTSFAMFFMTYFILGGYDDVRSSLKNLKGRLTLFSYEKARSNDGIF